MNKNYVHHQRTGFTLIELLVAAGITIIAMAGMLSFTIYYTKNYSFSFEENQEINQAQTGMTLLLKDMREARASQDGAWTLVDTQDTSFIFYSDVTNDSKVDRVRYFIDGTQLKRGVIEPANSSPTYPATGEKIRVIADSIDQANKALFTYYDGNWPADQINNPLPADKRIANTRYVKVYLRISVNPGAGAQPFELTSGVQIRSLKDNL